MVDVSSGLEILAEIKLKSENKGLLQASRLSPHLCRRDFPLGLPQAWPPNLGSSMAQLSTLGWCASQQENLLLRPKQGGLLATSQPGARPRPVLGCVICAQLGIRSSAVSEEHGSCLDFQNTPPVLEMGLETEIASSPG